MTYLPTRQEIEAAKTLRGGWTKAQLAEWGVPWPPKHGWKQRLLCARKEMAGQTQTDPPAIKESSAMDGM